MTTDLEKNVVKDWKTPKNSSTHIAGWKFTPGFVDVWKIYGKHRYILSWSVFGGMMFDHLLSLAWNRSSFQCQALSLAATWHRGGGNCLCQDANTSWAVLSEQMSNRYITIFLLNDEQWARSWGLRSIRQGIKCSRQHDRRWEEPILCFTEMTPRRCRILFTSSWVNVQAKAGNSRWKIGWFLPRCGGNFVLGAMRCSLRVMSECSFKGACRSHLFFENRFFLRSFSDVWGWVKYVVTRQWHCFHCGMWLKSTDRGTCSFSHSPKDSPFPGHDAAMSRFRSYLNLALVCPQRACSGQTVMSPVMSLHVRVMFRWCHSHVPVMSWSCSSNARSSVHQIVVMSRSCSSHETVKVFGVKSSNVEGLCVKSWLV